MIRVCALALFASLVNATVWLIPARAQPAAPVAVGPRVRPYYPRYYFAPYPVYADAPALTPGATTGALDGTAKWPASQRVVTVPVVGKPGSPSWPGIERVPVAPAAMQTDEDPTAKLLTSPLERDRVDAAVSLARGQSEKAIDALQRALAKDTSVRVREAAARVLGLIGSPAALDALQTAAQNDKDRDVRDSARFAAEVIRTKVGKP